MTDPRDPQDSPAKYSQPPPQREIESRDLLQGQREIVIRHHGEIYRLSLTRNGKLILRK